MLASILTISAGAFKPSEADYIVERWRMQELSFTSTADYANPFGDIELDVIFTGPDNVTMVMPAFWDGGDTWKVRFAPTELGLWTYESFCSNEADAGLHGLGGTITCVPYEGDLDIYQRGFVKAVPDTRYFVYADGMPFFYLGDTH